MSLLRRRIMIANQKNDWYVTDGLLLHLDGIKNTRHGHDETASVWEDLSPNQNDAILYNMNTDYGYYGSTELGYVFLHNDAYAETIRNIGISGNDPHTVEIVAKPYSLDGVSDKPKGNGYLWFGSSGSVEGSSRCFRHKRNGANAIENTFRNGYSTLVDIEPKIGEIESVSFRSNKFGVIQIGDTDSYIVFYNGVYYTSKHSNRASNTQALIDSKAQIGRNWQFNSENRSFYGTIQSIRIYNRVLTDEEVLHNYNIDKIRFGIT